MLSLPSARSYIVGFGLLSQAVLCGCDSGSSAQPQIPLTAFNEVLFLTNQENSALRFDNGAVYHKGGVRGLIVVRQNASTYLAFERACTYNSTDTCARVKISPFVNLFDPCCKSQFNFQGQPQSGPANLPLRRYSTSLSGNTLTITN
ncbi:hypothetical protein [Hymenobacter cellulosilyticus]|uniref:Rieske domain-containing protein n=1 Tax=Hymenobacter cellulosilyticus TaxID=2932248 RepID=A0A8T9Q5W0_9BACT|nr:hypothetical protein [Hymenobacter cellulosilyticus]UOQ72917.1 hypothetical protein MUN79_02715 [Hymenobacter cellulosilyticus]